MIRKMAEEDSTALDILIDRMIQLGEKKDTAHWVALVCRFKERAEKMMMFLDGKDSVTDEEIYKAAESILASAKR